MKKYLGQLFMVALVVFAFGFTEKYFADLYTNDIYSTSPTLNGSLEIVHSGHNKVTMSLKGPSGTGPGAFLETGPNNTFSTLGQQFFSTQRGAVFSADLGQTNAVDVWNGFVGLNEVSGNTRVGTGADNGLDKFQVNGTVQISGGSPVAGEVLTALDATGRATWSPASGGAGTYGTYTPTFTYLANSSSGYLLEQASYSVNGKYVHVNISGQLLPTTGGGTYGVTTRCAFSLPFTVDGSLSPVGRRAGMIYVANGCGTIVPGVVNIGAAVNNRAECQWQTFCGGTNTFEIVFDYFKL